MSTQQTTSADPSPMLDAARVAGEELTGLTSAEVEERRAQGLSNTVSITSTRPYPEIIRHNVFTLINVVLYATCAMLIAIGLYGDAVVTIGLVLFNVVISILQEVRTKWSLDKISVLTWPRATVIREGEERIVDPSELVQADLLVVAAGDQIVADGPLVGGKGIEVDESLLTGESEPVHKAIGDKVLSGTFCVSGKGIYRAETVGLSSVANRLTRGAREFRQSKTPMQQDMDLIVRGTVLAVVFVGGPVLLDLFARAIAVVIRRIDQPSSTAIRLAFGGYPVEDTVRSAAVILALIPQGLALMVAVTYAAAALRLAGKGVLIQQTNAMESLSHVDVLCLDKTGTLTTNELFVDEVAPFGVERGELEQCAGDFAANTTSTNKTSEAIGNAFAGRRRRVVADVPFNSARKWSAMTVDDDHGQGVFVMGAPDVLAPHLSDREGIGDVVADWSGKGRRVILLACNPDPRSLDDANDAPQLPELQPIGLIGLVDGLRDESRETLKHFQDLGVRLKLISGDDPRTVAALARNAGFPIEGDVISGSDLGQMDDDAFAECAARGSVFGRTTPDQKERLIGALQRDGKYVAMTGDGVNDVPALKRANMGIAMRSGSDAARGVADLVLLEDSFGALPKAFAEGQRIVSGMQDIAALFLVRSLSVMLILVGAAFVTVPFPLTPRDNALLAFLTVGIPTLGLAAWAKPETARNRLLRPIARFAIPASIMVATLSLITFMTWWRLTHDIDESQSVLTTTAVLCGLILLPFIQPPVQWFVGGDEYSGDWRPTLLAAGLFGGFLGIAYTPALQRLFGFARVDPRNLAILVVIVGVWAVALRWVWRSQFFQRIAGLRSSGQPAGSAVATALTETDVASAAGQSGQQSPSA